MLPMLIHTIKHLPSLSIHVYHHCLRLCVSLSEFIRYIYTYIYICPNLCCYTRKAFIYRWTLEVHNKNYVSLIPCTLVNSSPAICHLLHISLWTFPLHPICTPKAPPSPGTKNTQKWAITDTTTHIPEADMLWELNWKFKKKQQIKALNSTHATGNEDFSQSVWCTESCVVQSTAVLY